MTTPMAVREYIKRMVKLSTTLPTDSPLTTHSDHASKQKKIYIYKSHSKTFTEIYPSKLCFIFYPKLDCTVLKSLFFSIVRIEKSKNRILCC